MKPIMLAMVLAWTAPPVVRGLAAQRTVVWQPAAPVEPLGSEAEERSRLAQLRGEAPLDGFLLRSASSRAPALGGPAGAGRGTIFVAPWWPEVSVVSNSTLPFSLNDGPLWAGRGLNASITGGVRARYGVLRLVLAPAYVYSANDSFPLPVDVHAAPEIPPARSRYSYPWRVYGPSIDLPVRFGPDPYQRLDWGQSALYARFRSVEVGLSTENEWWGPAVRNAIVMSNNAPGIPKLFVRTARPIGTPIGTVEARYFIGSLTTSPFFETAPEPGRRRSLSAAAVTLRPSLVPTLTFGATRSVFAQLADGATVAGHALDVLSDPGRPNAVTPVDSTQRPGRDQIYSLFARWVLPDDGFESYVEWGRTERPASLRDFLVAPNHTQGYTLGLQYARPTGWRRATVRVQAEVTNVAQSSTFRERPIGSWYTSRAAIQGYTQRGQVIGAAIGPGSASEWLAGDLFAGSWSGGVFVGRIRWDDDALYLDPTRGICHHDVSLYGGVRGSRRFPEGLLTASLTLADRLNTFYQNDGSCFSERFHRIDRHNTTFTVTFVPFGRGEGR